MLLSAARPMSPSSLSADVFVGSLAAEVATKMLVHPLDTLKTRLQYLVVPRRATVTRRQWLPLISDVALGLELLTQATRSPHHSLVDPPLLKLTRGSRLFNGLRSLYRGIGPQLLGVLPISVVYMPSYELASSIFRETPLQFTPAAGVVTGVVSAVVRVPVSVIKSRMQLGLHQSGAEVRHSPLRLFSQYVVQRVVPNHRLNTTDGCEAGHLTYWNRFVMNV